MVELLSPASDTAPIADADVACIFERLYASHYSLLLRVAVSKFRLRDDEVEPLINDVFVSLMVRFEEVRDVRSWLIGGISNACRAHLRASRRLTPLPDDAGERLSAHNVEADSLAVMNDILERIDARSASILRLRYLDGCTIPEIAERMSTTPRYAEKLLRKALARAEGLFKP